LASHSASQESYLDTLERMLLSSEGHKKREKILEHINIEDEKNKGNLSLFEYMCRTYVFYENSKGIENLLFKYYELERAFNTLNRLIASIRSFSNRDKPIKTSTIIDYLKKYNANRQIHNLNKI
jgi:hypothetical protein